MRNSRLSTNNQKRLIELFVAESTARTAAALVDINKSTASYYFQRLCQLIHDHSQHLEMFEGEIKVDESYFGGRRKGKRGRGAAGKLPVFGLLKRSGKVFTVIIPDTKANTLMPIIREQVKLDRVVYTDTWGSYNALDVSEFKHYRINHSKLFANKRNHLNGIENFWNPAKRHMRKFMVCQKRIFTSF